MRDRVPVPAAGRGVQSGRDGPDRVPADLRLPDERAGLRGNPRHARRPGLRCRRSRGGCRRHSPEHLLGARARRGAGDREDGPHAEAQARAPRPGPRHPGLHGQDTARRCLSPPPASGPRGGARGDLRSPRPAGRRRREPAARRARSGCAHPRRRPQGAAARPPAGDRLPGGSRHRVRHDHGRLRQEVRLLHRADDSGPGGLAAGRRDPRRGPAARAGGLSPGHLARPERELLREALPRRIRLAWTRPPACPAPDRGRGREGEGRASRRAPGSPIG